MVPIQVAVIRLSQDVAPPCDISVVYQKYAFGLLQPFSYK